MRTENEQREWELQCYGMTEAQVIAEKPNHTDPLMWAMSILSDAQHCMDFEDSDLPRQYINKAKFWIGQTRREISSTACTLRLATETLEALGR